MGMIGSAGGLSISFVPTVNSLSPFFPPIHLKLRTSGPCPHAAPRFDREGAAAMNLVGRGMRGSLPAGLTRLLPGNVDYSNIITIEPGKRSGKPCVRNLRITVYDVLESQA